MPGDEISLNAKWALAYFDEGCGQSQGAHLPDCDVSGWLDAIVPGDVHLDLTRAGKISDLFYGLNRIECRWVEDKEWWYRREFFVPERLAGKRIDLQFGGLDTFATVWVNGKLAGSHSNMFIPCSFDVSTLLDYGRRNTVAVRLSSPIKAIEGKSVKDLHIGYGTHERLHARKAQMSYGCEIAPRLVTIGIWRPVYLTERGRVSIGDVAVQTSLPDPSLAMAHLEIPIKRNDRTVKSVRLEIEARHGMGKKQTPKKSITVPVGKADQLVEADLEIADPKLWWPWTAGRPDLYRLSVKALVGDEVEEEHRTNFGIRTVELLQEAHEYGDRGFTLSINGQRIYAKGANWTPGDTIFARMNRKKYRELIDLSLSGNINILRVWGGGVYEDPYFYRLCDERGIMVWQDFMFSRAEYPEDEEFLAEVRREARAVVAGLRNHPSIVLWCGGDDSSDTKPRRSSINNEILPDVCSQLDPTRPYIPDSATGEVCAWNQAEGSCRFASRIDPPRLESVHHFIPDGDPWSSGNNTWDPHLGALEREIPSHVEMPMGQASRSVGKLDWAIEHLGFERPGNSEDFAFLSQLIQGLAYQERLEHCRRRKFLCGGSMYSGLNDSWPRFSNAAVGLPQGPKIAYYFAARAFSNLLVSLQDLDDGLVGVWLINDELRDRSGRLLLRCQRFDGGIAWTRVLPVKLPANSSRMVWEMRPPGPLMEEPTGCFVQAQLLVNGRVVSENFHFPAEFKDIRWPETHLSARYTRVSESSGQLKVHLSVASLFYGRLVRVETPGRRSRFSSNFFDIPPGEERPVQITMEKDPACPILVRVSAVNARKSIEIEPE